MIAKGEQTFSPLARLNDFNEGPFRAVVSDRFLGMSRRHCSSVLKLKYLSIDSQRFHDPLLKRHRWRPSVDSASKSDLTESLLGSDHNVFSTTAPIMIPTCS